jgi:hypothetical protein
VTADQRYKLGGDACRPRAEPIKTPAAEWVVSNLECQVTTKKSYTQEFLLVWLQTACDEPLDRELISRATHAEPNADVLWSRS